MADPAAPARRRPGGAAGTTAGAPRRPRWRRRRDARPGEILDAALACFTARGFAATRMDDIARRAGVTRGTLYLYFPSKEELFKELVRRSVVPVVARAEAMIARSHAPTPALIRSLLLVLGEAANTPPVSALPKLVIAEAGNFPDLARFYLDEVIGRARALVRVLVRRGAKRGELRPPASDTDHVHIFYCLMAPIVLAALWRHSFAPFDDTPLDAAALVRIHADVVLNGLLPRAPAP